MLLGDTQGTNFDPFFAIVYWSSGSCFYQIYLSTKSYLTLRIFPFSVEPNLWIKLRVGVNPNCTRFRVLTLFEPGLLNS